MLVTKGDDFKDEDDEVKGEKETDNKESDNTEQAYYC